MYWQRINSQAATSATFGVCQVRSINMLFQLFAVGGAIMAATPALGVDEALRLQGSTTFNATLLEPHRSQIEKTLGHPLTVVANKSSWGLLALVEGRADVAMISAGLPAEIAAARKLTADPLASTDALFDTLQEHRVSTARVAFAVHPANPLKRLRLETVAQILKGQITNWSAVGGADVAIKVVAVKEGGGTVVTVRSHMIGDAPLPPGSVRLENARHVLKVVAQEPGAISITQFGLMRQAGLHEIETDRPVEQALSLITRGPPTAAALRLIEAVRSVAGHDRD